MKPLFYFASLLTFAALAAEPADQPAAFPLWDGTESVADYAKRANLAPTKTLDLGNGVKLDLVLIPAGKFIMGTPEPQKPDDTVPKTDNAWQVYSAAKARFIAADPAEKPAHAVTLTRPFYMSKFTVTQEQYQQIAAANPSSFVAKDSPVEGVSWELAQDFCTKLAAQTKEMVRLPFEAEWEYACRAGSLTDYDGGNTEKDLDRIGWYNGNSKRSTHAVGQKAANAWGLFDMHGNVWQCCQDWLSSDYYAKSPAENPTGPAQGDRRVLRGGAWNSDVETCRAAIRYGNTPMRGGHVSIGIRVVVECAKKP